MGPAENVSLLAYSLSALTIKKGLSPFTFQLSPQQAFHLNYEIFFYGLVLSAIFREKPST